MPKHKNYIHTPDVASVNSSVKGQKGQTGLRGTDGRKGGRGQKGSEGLNGHTTTIVGSFSSASSSSLPKSGTIPVGWDGGVEPPIPFSLEVGESLVDSRTGELWCFTPGSNTKNWTFFGKVAGPRGLNGQDGSQGLKGQTGEKGTSGSDGTKGEHGQKGISGVKGSVGSLGERGHRGCPGASGSNGSRGAEGTKGQKGTRGTSGKNGTFGRNGLEGPQGEKGSPGSPGVRGNPGQRGLSGDPAPTHLLPRVGGTVNVANAGLHDKHNISKAEILKKGNLRIYFASPLSDALYTVMMTTQSGMEEEVLTSYVVKRAVNYVDVSVKTSLTDDYSDHGIMSLVIYRFIA